MTSVSQQLRFYLKQGCFKSRSAGFSLRTFGLSLSTMAKASSNPGTILDFEVKDIDGNTVKLDKYKGFVTVIVNVASKCGLTKTNYSQLPELHSRYAERGLRILAFPCNQFGGQEPGTEEEIKEFAQGHGVQFDVFGKIDVNGSNAHPLYVFLKNAKHGTLTNNIKWNFTKFLCDKKGVPMKRYSPTTSPVDIAKDIEKELDKE